MFVVFQGRIGAGGFWNIYGTSGYQHCWIAVPEYFPEPGLLATQYTMKIEPLEWGIDVAIWRERTDVVVKTFYEAGATAVVYWAKAAPCRGYVPRGVYSCVSICKAVLGIRAWYILTPWQLPRYMLNNGGSLIHPQSAGNV